MARMFEVAVFGAAMEPEFVYADSLETLISQGKFYIS
jgi:hypothetical protein